MTSEGMSLVPPPSQRLDGGLSSQLLFQEDALRFSCGPPQQQQLGDPGPKTRELSGFINDRYGQPQPDDLPDFRRGIFGEHHRLEHNQDRIDWNGNGRTSSGDGSEDDQVEDEDDDDDGVHERGIDPKSSGEPLDGDGFSFGKSKHMSPFGVGTSRGLILEEEGNDSIIAARADLNDSHQQEQIDQYQSAVTIADPEGDLYYSQYLQGQEVLGGGRQKDVAIENGCGFSGRTELGESLRVILSDPITGALMDDAMILPCGHSFGGGGVQHVIRIKACCTCSHPVSEESILPNLSLRAAIQAFQREEELHVHRSSKRRRERYEQDKGYYGDSTSMDHHHPRGRGVQFPFVVTDRVIIKGNKRTPLRFVGREAIVTTQCLNGWYVVKTLDNAESVKLQYRSLAKVPDNASSKPTLAVPAKMTPNWL